MQGNSKSDGNSSGDWSRILKSWAEREAWRPARGGRRLPAGSLETKELYRSANGDHWLLMHDPTSGSVFVRHSANSASGGQVTDIAVREFLTSGHGPEQQELLRLIGTLAEEPGTI